MNKIRFGVIGTNFITDWVIAGAKQDERSNWLRFARVRRKGPMNLLPNMIFPIHLLRWRKWRQVR